MECTYLLENIFLSIFYPENGSIMWTHDAPINRILGSTFNCCATLQILPSPPSGTYQIRVTIATSSGTAQNGKDSFIG